MVALQANGLLSHGPRKEDRQVGRRQVSGLWPASSSARDAASVAEAQKKPVTSARDLKLLPTLWTETCGYFKTTASCSQSTIWVKPVLTEEHELHRLAFTDSSVERQWYGFCRIL